MYVEGVLNYTGSKFKLLSQILPEFDYSKKYFIDLFAGSAVVGFNVVDKYDRILINDIIHELIGIHKGLLRSDDIIIKTKSLCPNKDSQEQFLALRESFNKEKTPEKLWALLLSSTNNVMRFNKQFHYNQTFGKRNWNNNTERKVNEFVKHIRPHKDKIFFTSMNFVDVKIPKPCMVYIDPPYSSIKNSDGSMSNKKISDAGYNRFYTNEDDVNLYNYCLNLNNTNSSFMISGVLSHNGNTSWLMDKLIQYGFRYKELDYNYNQISKKGDKETKEVIIMNY